MDVVEVNGVKFNKEWLKGHSLREAKRQLKKHPAKDVEEAYNKANGITPKAEKKAESKSKKENKKD